MKARTIFHFCLALAWIGLAVTYCVLAFQGQQVDAINGFCPSIVLGIMYADRVLEDLDKKEK